MTDPSPDKQMWLKILKETARFGYLTVKTIWLTVWTLYQIALGAVLVGLIYGLYKGGEYFSLWDIRALRHDNPKTTAFIDSERARMLDSLHASGRPLPDTLIHWSWMPIDSMPKIIQEAALIAEDAKFYDHQGFDLEQIEYAVVANHQAGKKARGASTITQQVAKNLFLWPLFSPIRKVLEFPLATWIDFMLPKQRILEIYLNVAELGPSGQFGAQAGSAYAFGRSASALSPREAALLAAILPNPLKRSARNPGPGVRRLAGTYMARAQSISPCWGENR